MSIFRRYDVYQKAQASVQNLGAKVEGVHVLDFTITEMREAVVLLELELSKPELQGERDVPSSQRTQVE